MTRNSSQAPSSDTSEYSDRLRSLMSHANISSFRALSQQANVSDWQIRQIRRGNLAQMRVEVLQRISQALKLSLAHLLESFLDAPVTHPNADHALSVQPQVQSLQLEYQRLQAQLQNQRDRLWQEFQLASLHQLEPWLTQWPTAAHAAHQNQTIPANRLVPLVRPVEQLVANWGLEAIAPVGAELPYDPQQHQLMEGGVPAEGWVKVRYVGYCWSGKLLYRAKVSPIPAPD